MIERIADYLPPLNGVTGLLVVLAVALLGHLLARMVLLRVVHGITRHTTATWDDALVRERVFGRVAQVVPALVLYTGIPLVPGIDETLAALARNVALGYMVTMVTVTLTATIRAMHNVYSTLPGGRYRPVKGFVQIAQLAVYILGAVMVIAAVMDRSPLLLLSGLGAMGAILLLVFKDTILGFVASVQLAAQDMVRVGDWIEMPQFGADGDVIDVALNTVRVQNWDKTITTIPTYALISGSFRNWRGMTEAGGRRIMRSLQLDVSSVRFLSAAEIGRFKRFALLSEYIDRKLAELAEYNDTLQQRTDSDVNLRRLTNIGTFRAYMANYLRNHPGIRQDMTLIVRQLAAGPEGIPIEVYAFSNDIRWDVYEGIQGDIFDHMLAIVPEFGLALFQNPTGADFRRALDGAQQEAGNAESVSPDR